MSIDKDMYELTLKRQRIRTYVQTLQRDTQQQKDECRALLEEEREAVRAVTAQCELAMAQRKKLEVEAKRREVLERERERELSSKRAKLKKQMHAALVCASVDLSRV